MRLAALHLLRDRHLPTRPAVVRRAPGAGPAESDTSLGLDLAATQPGTRGGRDAATRPESGFPGMGDLRPRQWQVRQVWQAESRVDGRPPLWEGRGGSCDGHRQVFPLQPGHRAVPADQGIEEPRSPLAVFVRTGRSAPSPTHSDRASPVRFGAPWKEKGAHGRGCHVGTHCRQAWRASTGRGVRSDPVRVPTARDSPGGRGAGDLPAEAPGCRASRRLRRPGAEPHSPQSPAW